MDRQLPVWALIGLGTTQIIGYGTLYYCVSILVPGIAHDLAVAEQWVFGIFSLALLVGALMSPLSGGLSDRFGAGRVMAVGSAGSAAALALVATSTGAFAFAGALAFTQVVSAGVLYSTAFTAIVQVGGQRAQTSIIHLTLIAGFASSLTWPLTTWLIGFMSWREVLFLYAALHLVVCLPIHLGIAKLTSGAVNASKSLTTVVETDRPETRKGRLIFTLMLAGFALESYLNSAILVHMVPLTHMMGFGAAGLFIASLFGPAQVASRFLNLVLGVSLSQTHLAVTAAILMPISIAILLLTAPSFGGAVAFAICMGLGSGLMSITAGTLPLELFGRQGYGKLMGWSTSAKQVASGIAPFLMSASMSTLGVVPSLWTIVLIGLLATAALTAIPLVLRIGDRGNASYGPTT